MKTQKKHVFVFERKFTLEFNQMTSSEFENEFEQLSPEEQFEKWSEFSEEYLRKHTANDFKMLIF